MGIARVQTTYRLDLGEIGLELGLGVGGRRHGLCGAMRCTTKQQEKSCQAGPHDSNESISTNLGLGGLAFGLELLDALLLLQLGLEQLGLLAGLQSITEAQAKPPFSSRRETQTASRATDLVAIELGLALHQLLRVELLHSLQLQRTRGGSTQR